MPHKVNPETYENIKSLWKAFVPRMQTVFMDSILEHQRDLTNSASSRFLTELFTAFDYAIYRLRRALDEMDVKADNMRRNLALSAEDTIAEPIYLLMAYYGVPDGYDHTRKLIGQVHETGKSLTALLWEDETFRPFLDQLTEPQREALRDPTNYIGDSVRLTHATCDEWEERTSEMVVG